MEHLNEDFIRNLIQNEQKSFKQVSQIMKEMLPNTTRGLSEHNIRRFCIIHNISPRIANEDVEQIVEESILQVLFYLEFFFPMKFVFQFNHITYFEGRSDIR